MFSAKGRTIDSQILEWVSHPAKNNMKGIALSVSIVLLASSSVGLLVQSWGASMNGALLAGGVSGLFLLFSLRNFFWPTKIRLDENGIVVKEALYSRRRPWSACKSLHTDKFGVLISPFRHETRLENYRGLYIRFSGNRAQVIEFIERKIEAANDIDTEAETE
jgi:hypothetical protein